MLKIVNYKKSENMKNKAGLQDAIFWQMNSGDVIRCDKDLEVDIAIVGGGIAGLAAAQQAVKLGKKVALFEQHYCGSGATGKSSGFVTPNAELSFIDFSKKYSAQGAHKIWDFITQGVQDIKSTIKNYNLDCDYIEQDTLVVASRMRDLKKLQEECMALQKIKYHTEIYDRTELANHIGTDTFFGGVVYKDTFGINPYQYCQSLKKELQRQGVLIFEETPILKIEKYFLYTHHAKIKADYTIVCVDRFLPDLGLLVDDVFHAQTFVLASKPLSEDQVQRLFPKESYMAWDTELIYNYFRLTGDNRLLLGGGDLLSTYAGEKHHYKRITRKLLSYCEKVFPGIGIEFEYQWPGLIGLSKDIAPIAGRDKEAKNIYYVAASAGLPIASALGKYSVEHLYSGRADLDHYFSPYRTFPIGGMVQKILGKRASFALCNVIKQNIP